MSEIWKPVVGYEGIYEVSSFGRVRSIDRIVNGGSRWGKRPEHKHGKILSQFSNVDGYKCVHIKIGGKQKEYRVHRLVAFAFLGKPEGDQTEVNHIDGDKTNNSVDNLEWVSHTENMRHAFSVLGYDFTGKLGRSGRLVKCVDTGEIFKSVTEATRKYGGTQGGLWYALARGCSVYRGKKYEYIKIGG